MNLALEIVLNNKRLNEGIIPSVFLNEKTEKTGVIMTVYFYKEDRIFELESKIRYRTNFDGEMHFYYEYEILRNKAKSTVKSKRDIFDFSKNVGFKETKRDKMPKESLKVLKDEDSIVITETKDSGITINTMFEDFRDKINYIQGKIDKNILNVLRKHKRLERIGR